MKLSVGLINSDKYWEEFFKQAGISVKKITNDDLSDNIYSVIIICDEIPADQKNSIMGFLSEGGCVITDSLFAQKLFNISFQKRKIKYLYPQDDSVFNNEIFIDIYKNLLVPSGANHLANQDQENTILIKNYDKGLLTVLPYGLIELIYSYKTKRKNFFSRHGKDFPTEIVSQTGKGGIYHILYRMLEYLFHKKNLPFIRLWQFPDGNETIFGFRIDTDFADDNDIYDLYNSISRNKINGTWFIETYSRKDNCKIFKDFNSQEIGLHCYRHKLYSDKKRNFSDMASGLKILNQNGIHPAGYASPFGEWNESFGSAVREFNFSYTSEFGYIYDSLPVFPEVNNKVSDVLQIPIHPVSVGRLNISGHNETNMINYFSDIIQLKKKAYEPVFLYTHPSQKRFNVFNKVFEIVNESGINSTLFNDYAVWWKQRNRVRWEPEIKGNNILINTESKDKSVWVHLSYKSGKNYLAPITASDLLSFKEIKEKYLEMIPGFNPGLVTKMSWKIIKQDLIYNYRKLKY